MKQPLAYVHPEAQVADNVVIEPFVTIDKNVVIEEGTRIGSNVTILEGAVNIIRIRAQIKGSAEFRSIADFKSRIISVLPTAFS